MRRRLIAALVGAGVLGVLLRYTVFFDATAYLERRREAVLDGKAPPAVELAELARFHRGELPCLVDPPPFSDEQARVVAAEVKGAGLENALSLLGFWVSGGERERHGEVTDEEVAAYLRVFAEGTADRALVALNRAKLVAAARAMREKETEDARRREAKLAAELTPEQIDALRTIWLRHEHELTFAGLVAISRHVSRS